MSHNRGAKLGFLLDFERSWSLEFSTHSAQDFLKPADHMGMERRFFERVDTSVNGELIWATKGSFGRVTTHRVYITSENLSIDGIKVLIDDSYDFPMHSRARLKLGLEFCDVEVLGIDPAPAGQQGLRLTFLAPHQRFLEVVEKWLPKDHEIGENVKPLWAG